MTPPPSRSLYYRIAHLWDKTEIVTQKYSICNDSTYFNLQKNWFEIHNVTISKDKKTVNNNVHNIKEYVKLE